jgi:hypothetical protein
MLKVNFLLVKQIDKPPHLWKYTASDNFHPKESEKGALVLKGCKQHIASFSNLTIKARLDTLSIYFRTLKSK